MAGDGSPPLTRTPIYIGVGSNIDAEKNTAWAMRLLAREIELTDISTFYITEPLGAPGSPPFYNGVVAGATELDIAGVRRLLFDIEDRLGRKRTEDKYAPRPIDLDLLLFGDEVAAGEGWCIPHPDIHLRSFVAIPLLEIAPQLTLPGSGRSLGEIAGQLAPLVGEPLSAFTERMRALLAG